MATNTTKQRIAMEMANVLIGAVDRKEVTPAEGEEIMVAVARALERTNVLMRAAGKGAFIDEGVVDKSEEDWS